MNRQIKLTWFPAMPRTPLVSVAQHKQLLGKDRRQEGGLQELGKAHRKRQMAAQRAESKEFVGVAERKYIMVVMVPQFCE